MPINISNLSIIMATHSRTDGGMPQLLLAWLNKRSKKVAYVDHPLPTSDKKFSSLTTYTNGEKKVYARTPDILAPQPVVFVKDFFMTVYYGLKVGSEFDLGIGIDNLNTAALIILRKFGRVKYVIYHTVDYTPNRFKNPILNNIYHAIDRFACYNANMIWNSSGRMNEGRIRNGADGKRIAHTIITPDGSNFDHKRRLPLSKIERKKIVFLAHMRPGMGLDMLINTALEVIKRVPDVKYLIIGDGPLFRDFKNKIKMLGLEKNFKLTGYVKYHKDVDNLVRTGAIGLAPFEMEKDSIEYYSDVGKPKVYLAAGQPVVISKLPEIAYEIEKEKAGFAITNEKEFVKAIVTLLTNDSVYREYRENAIRLGEKYKWNNIFEEAFSKTFSYLNIKE